MHRNTELKAYFAGTFFSLLVGFSFLGTKICIDYADAITIMTYRFDFAMLALAVLLIVKKERPIFSGKPKKTIAAAGLSYSFFLLLQAAGMVYATSVEAAILSAAAPAFVEVIALVFLKEKANIRQTICVMLVIAALVVMIALDAESVSFNPAATGILLVSTFLMSLYTVAVRGCSRDYSSLEIGTSTVVTGFVLFNAVMMIRCFMDGFSVYTAPASSMEFIISAGYLGIFCILVSATLTGYMGQYLESTVMSVFGNVSAAISIVAGALILGEPVYVYYIVCSALIIAGVIGTAYWSEGRI